MSQNIFKFKEFSIAQDRCAMKIGTDGVLLGAWTLLEHQPESILDIGTGTGLIALMLAQRSSAQLIDAVEIDGDAYEQAVENFENSPWSDRLFCYHAAFDEFVEEMQEEVKYDLIIANPPFYSEDNTTNDSKRTLARFSAALPFPELIEGVSKLLSPEGKFAVVLPSRKEKSFIEQAANHKLFPEKITRVRGHQNSPLKRSLLCLTRSSISPEVDELNLEISRHNYTEAFKKMVTPFYLDL